MTAAGNPSRSHENSTTAPSESPEIAAGSPRWRSWTRVGFRFVFCYFIQYALCSDHKTVLERVPVLGRGIQNILFAPYDLASLWLARHAFHLTGASVIAHGSGFGDRAVDWISAGLMLVVAAVATLIWTLLDRKRPNYQILFAWLRFLLRLTVGLSMLWYASIKIFPIQIEPPSLAVLNEPLGQTSPMTLLWSLLGLSHTYERICGFAELFGGVLILFRRTALLGALISAAILVNIVLLDNFFDVAVKLYSFNLLLMCMVVIAPDGGQLLRLFWSHQPAVPSTAWVSLSNRLLFQRLTMAFEVVFLISCLNPLRTSYRQYAKEVAGESHPSSLAGQWKVDTSTLDGQPHPFLTGDGQPMTDLFLEPSGRDTVRAADGTLWTGGRYDVRPHSLWVITPTRGALTYDMSQPDATHLRLTPADEATAQIYPVITLSRVPIALHYRIYDRGFHWINEWGFER